jgi:hypothetical protein
MGRKWHFDLSKNKPRGVYCPFKHHCVFLEGEPPEKILTERNYFSKRINYLEEALDWATEEITKLRKERDELVSERENLQADLLQARQAPFKKYEKYEKKEPPANPKQRGAPKGHPSWYRKKPDHIDEFIDVFLEKCPLCGAYELSACSHITRHIQEDIEDGRVKATCFIHHYYWCMGCKETVHGWGEKEIPHAFIGPEARAKASFLKYDIKTSYNDTQRVLDCFSGLTVVPGAIVGFDNKLHKEGEPLYEALKETLPHTDYLHADETGWKRHWLWIFTNPDIAFFHIDESRGSQVVIDLLGDFYNGILITDFWNAYRNKIPAFAKQKCLVHLLRDIKELLNKGLTDNPDAKVFLNDLKQLIKDAILLHNLYPELTSDEWRSGKKKILKRFKTLRRNAPLSHHETDNIRKRLITFKNELFVFLKYPRVSPTNNRAESGIRGGVLYRKISFGNMVEQGRKNVALIMTIIRTAKLRLLDPIKVLKTILTDGVTPDLLKQFGIPKVMPEAP